MTCTIMEIIAKEARHRGVWAELADTDSLRTDLNFDDVSVAGVSLAIEEAFLVEFTDDQTRNWLTVGDVLGAVKKGQA